MDILSGRLRSQTTEVWSGIKDYIDVHQASEIQFSTYVHPNNQLCTVLNYSDQDANKFLN